MVLAIQEIEISPWGFLEDDWYVELHRHSTYSIYDGYGRPQVAAMYAAKRGQIALALTDHGVMGGQVEHWKYCREAGIKPICGVEGYFQPIFSPGDPDYHMTVLVKNQKGWENLCRMLTEANQTSFYRHAIFTKELLEKYHEGLIVASGCVGGYIPQLLIACKQKTARKEAIWFSELFEDDYYFEVMPFAVKEQGLNIQQIVNHGVIALAQLLDRRIIMTSDAHYIEQQEYDTYLMLAEIANTTLVADYSQLYMHRACEMADAWNQMMGTDGTVYIKETRLLADTIEEIDLHFADMAPTMVWEKPSSVMLAEIIRENLQIMGKWDLSEAQEDALFLAQERSVDATLMVKERNAARREIKAILAQAPYAARAFHEYDVITHVGFVDYFLIMYDIANFARSKNIKCSARGSVCGSLIAHALWISQVDPLLSGTYFEKFMRKDKRIPPDIDMDFDPAGRSLIFAYVFEKYPGRAAHISNYGYFKIKSLVNEMLKRYPAISFEHGIGIKIRLEQIHYEEFPVSYEELITHPTEGHYFRTIDGLYPTFLDKFTRLFGQIKNLGMHAAGVMITKNEISSYLPLQYVAKTKTFQTAADMKSIDTMGGMKFDLLGVDMLGIIADIEQLTGCSYDPAILHDTSLYEHFCAGDTEGIFQFGASRGIKDLLRKVQPTSDQELIAVNAMYRPGPLTSGIIDHYVAGKNGDVDTSAPWYDLTKDTYGVIVYQEQAMYTCLKLAGMAWADIDIMMKGISKKKIPKEIERSFLQGLQTHGAMSEEDAGKLYESMKLYSFNKNHSASYTQIAIYNMWLRVHYPTEFWWATLRHTYNTKKGEDKINLMESAAFNAGQMLLLPHVNGGFNYEIVEIEGERYIRKGMRTVKGVGPGTAQTIERNRKDVPYTDVDDLKKRVPSRSLNVARLAALIDAGATIDLTQHWEKYAQQSIKYCSKLRIGGRS